MRELLWMHTRESKPLAPTRTALRR